MQQDLGDFGTLEPSRRTFRADGRQYVLTEASESAAVAYQNASSAAARYDAETGRKVSFEGLHDCEMILVSLCVFEADGKGGFLHYAPNSEGHKMPCPVGMSVVGSWKADAVERLFHSIKEMSPTLSGRETVDSLTKEIDRLTSRRETLRKHEERNKEGEKGPHPTSDTGVTSGSPTGKASA